MVVAGAAVAACSNAIVPGTPKGQSTALSSPVPAAFDPCSDLTDFDIESFGLDPATKENTTSRVFNVTSGCRWENREYLFSVTTGPGSIEALESSNHFFSVMPIQVQGRDAARVVITPDVGNCHVGIPSGVDIVDVSVTLIYKAPEVADNSCALVTDLVNKIVTKIPR